MYTQKFIHLYSVFLFIGGIIACKPGKAVADTKQPAASNTVAAGDTSKGQKISQPKTNGTVSHRYSATGCGPVIITDKVSPRGDTLILIPVKGLDGFDIDGLQISFNYRRLMIKNPQGCEHGGPVLISNVTKR